MDKTNKKSIRFLVFADLHYKKGMYISCVNDVKSIMKRAKESRSELVVHLGDFCNDYIGSPEVVDAYINNEYNLPVYGVYGNHELESNNNSMEYVTPLLCNREVRWGTQSGNIEDARTGYYFFDINGFRFIGLDTNYSLSPHTKQYEHNRTASWGMPDGNEFPDSLGYEQLVWLEGVLDDAAEKALRCIILSHASFSKSWNASSDIDAVRTLIEKTNERRNGTILMCINGHYHTNHLEMSDDVLYFDVNTVRNGYWTNNPKKHYGDLTYTFTDYDSNGREKEVRERRISDLRMADNTWFFESALSAVVSITAEGKIEIEGAETKWLYNIIPPCEVNGIEPRISGGAFKIPL